VTTQTAQPPYEYPLALDSELESVTLADDLVLKRLDEPTRERLLGISNLKLDSSGRVKSFTSNAGGHELLSPDLDRTMIFYASNFLLVAPNTALANDFNFALKLLGNSWSSLFIGYRQGGTVAFSAPPCYFGQKRQKLREHIVPELQHVLAAISRAENEAKLGLMVTSGYTQCQMRRGAPVGLLKSRLFWKCFCFPSNQLS